MSTIQRFVPLERVNKDTLALANKYNNNSNNNKGNLNNNWQMQAPNLRAISLTPTSLSYDTYWKQVEMATLKLGVYKACDFLSIPN